jgi:hypothetical protein
MGVSPDRRRDAQTGGVAGALDFSHARPDHLPDPHRLRPATTSPRRLAGPRRNRRPRDRDGTVQGFAREKGTRLIERTERVVVEGVMRKR